jgi:hypothetical protein
MNSNYVHSDLGAWNWGKIGSVVNNVSGAVGNVSGAVQSFAPNHANGGYRPQPVFVQQTPNQSQQTNQTQHQNSNGLLYAALGGGILGLIGLTAALIN